MRWKRSGIGVLMVIGVSAILGTLITSCAPEEVAMMPIVKPGVKYVGTSTCAECHEKEFAYFKRSKHATVTLNLNQEGQTVNVEGCETCHGPGSAHIESENKRDILRGAAQTQACFNCHLQQKAQFKLQHHHPVIEGRMNCSACHDLHGKNVKSVANLKRHEDQTCFKCHKDKKGPFVFEHDAMREGCTVCHNPHGSVQDKMLLAGQSVICLRCHYDINTNQAQGLGGGVHHGAKVGANPGGNYDIGRGEECIDHHRSIHGSNIWRTFNH